MWTGSIIAINHQMPMTTNLTFMSSASRSAASACFWQLSLQLDNIYPGLLSHSPIPAHSAVSFEGIHANNMVVRRANEELLIMAGSVALYVRQLTAIFMQVLCVDVVEDHHEGHNYD